MFELCLTLDIRTAGAGVQRWGGLPPYEPLDGKVAPVFMRDASYMYMSGNLTLRRLPKRRDHPRVSLVVS